VFAVPLRAQIAVNRRQVLAAWAASVPFGQDIERLTTRQRWLAEAVMRASIGVQITTLACYAIPEVAAATNREVFPFDLHNDK
jgi:hypothetical protein